MAVILDASALLAFLYAEPGQVIVAEVISAGAKILTVNVAEVVAVMVRDGLDSAGVGAAVADLPIEIVDFDFDLALSCGRLIAQGKKFGLSLGDRACLALAMRSGEAVLTADLVWLNLADVLGIDVRALR